MALKPMAAFDHTVVRARHLVDLYDLLHNRRQRRVGGSRELKIKKLLGWKASDNICQIDGKGAVLLIRDGSKWDLKHFEHEWLGELLRSAIVSAVSALDRYLHDLIASKLLSLLKGKTPGSLARFQIKLADVESMLAKALESRGKDAPATRPRTILKDCFRNSLNQRTFQGAVQIESGMGMLGINECWGKIAQRMGCTANRIRAQLTRIVNRRNKIVHEGDIKQGSRPREIELNTITIKGVREDIDWLEKLVKAIDGLILDYKTPQPTD